MPVSSYLCESRLGWPSVFYLFGGLGVLWFVAWALLVHDGPDVHPRISPQEKLFLQVTRDTPFKLREGPLEHLSAKLITDGQFG